MDAFANALLQFEWVDRGLGEFVLGVEADGVEFDTGIFWGQFAERDFRAKRHLHSDF